MRDPNKAAAIEFLRIASRGEVERAYDRYVAEGFRHHNPWFAGDAGTLMRGMADNARQHPGKVYEALRAVAEGDLVCVHGRVRLAPGERPIAVVHIFRFEGDRIAELWDVGQPEPEQMANQYGMF